MKLKNIKLYVIEYYVIKDVIKKCNKKLYTRKYKEIKIEIINE